MPLEVAMARIFTPQKLANASDHGSPSPLSKSSLLTIYQHITGPWTLLHKHGMLLAFGPALHEVLAPNSLQSMGVLSIVTAGGSADGITQLCEWLG